MALLMCRQRSRLMRLRNICNLWLRVEWSFWLPLPPRSRMARVFRKDFMVNNGRWRPVCYDCDG